MKSIRYCLWFGTCVLAFHVGMLGGIANADGDDNGSVLVVDKNDPNAIYVTIQSAINDASPGDRIEVRGGIYTELLTINFPDLSLDGNSEAVIEATNTNSNVITITSGKIRIKGFVIQNGRFGINSQGPIEVEIEDNVIRGCTQGGIDVLTMDGVIENNECVGNNGFGMRVTAFNTTIKDNLCHGNDGIGFDIEGEDLEIKDNVANANDGDGFLLLLDDGSVEDNTAIHNSDDGFEVLANESLKTASVFESNLAEHNDYGFYLNGTGHVFAGNEALVNKFDGFWCRPTLTECVFTENDSNGNGDCGFRDQSSGSGTAGTANIYEDNECLDNGCGSEPPGLCDEGPPILTFFEVPDSPEKARETDRRPSRLEELRTLVRSVNETREAGAGDMGSRRP